MVRDCLLSNLVDAWAISGAARFSLFVKPCLLGKTSRLAFHSLILGRSRHYTVPLSTGARVYGNSCYQSSSLNNLGNR